MSKRGHNLRGFFVSFEGGEGCGKGDQQKETGKHLTEKGYKVTYGREPGTTDFGERIRSIVMDPNISAVHLRTELLLYTAARSEFIATCVRPVLKAGGIFLADRNKDSSPAYQGYGAGLDLNAIKFINDFAMNGINPDMTMLLDIEAEIGLAKLTGHEFAGHKHDKIEGRGLEYHKRVNAGYREMAKQEPHRFRVIKYVEGGKEQMQREIRQHVDEFIKQHGLDSTLARTA